MEILQDLANGLIARLHGPAHLRFTLQPLVASYLAFRDGRKDAREGKPPFLWSLFAHPEYRGEMLYSSVKSVGKVFVVAVILDLVFQYLEFHELTMRGGALLAGVILALLPYCLLRGPTNRPTQIRSVNDTSNAHQKRRLQH